VYQFVNIILPFLPGKPIVILRGSKQTKIRIPGSVWLLFTLLKAIVILATRRPDYAIINSSLSKECLIRDGILIRLLRLFRIPVYLIIHGFEEEALKYDVLLRNTYFKAKKIFVLAKSFALQLQNAGYKGKTISQFNPVAIDLLEKLAPKTLHGRLDNLLFLSRVEANKGIFITLDMFKQYCLMNQKASLMVAGNGNALVQAKAHAQAKGMDSVEFLGFISGQQKIEAYLQADIMILPTTHKEGLPITVLEAMAAGVIVITRPIGGLVDLHEQIEFGALTSSLDAQDYFAIVQKLDNEELILKLKQQNREFAREHFHPKKIVEALLLEIEND
jgi:glycosyltransferase involved in cell wall biosynthesis